METAVRGVKNVLRELRMLEGEIESPAYQIEIEQSKWIRAERGGFLDFHIKPGDIVKKASLSQPIQQYLGKDSRACTLPLTGWSWA